MSVALRIPTPTFSNQRGAPSMTRRQASFAISFVVLAVYWTLCFALTHLPLSSLPGVKRSLIPYQDKVAHLVLYGGLALLLAWVVSMVWRWNLFARVAVFVSIATYGMLDEWLQSFVPSRTMDVADWVADLAGLSLGLLCFELLGRLAVGVQFNRRTSRAARPVWVASGEKQREFGG